MEIRECVLIIGNQFSKLSTTLRGGQPQLRGGGGGVLGGGGGGLFVCNDNDRIYS